MKVADIMNREVATCRDQDSLNEAARLMWERDVGSLPVLNEDGRPVGMITDRDVCMAAYTQGGSLVGLRVQNAMARRVLSCAPADPVDKAEQYMREHKIRRLPVVESGRLVGIVSLNDIALVASDKRRAPVSFDEVGKTLAAICQHRQHATGAF